MHIFVTGGSGLTGPAIVSELLAHGHTVTGLARSEKAEQRLRELGAAVLRGTLDDHEVLQQGATAADGVIHMAFGGDFSDPESMRSRDVAAIEAIGRGLIGTGKPFVSTSGTLVMAPGRVGVETDLPDMSGLASFRIAGELACLGLAKHGVRSSVVRLAPTVHGPGDHGFIPMLIASARRTGVSVYIGSGSNRWPALHRLDAASLFRLALERAPAGTAWHGAGEGEVTFKSIAEKIGEKLHLAVRSITQADAPAHFGNPFFATIFGLDAPVSSVSTRQELGWHPTHATLIEDLSNGDYFADSASSVFANKHE